MDPFVRLTLSDDDLRRFASDGFIVKRGVVDVAAARSLADQISDWLPQPLPEPLFMVPGLRHRVAGCAPFVTSERLGTAAAQLLGTPPEVVLARDTLIAKDDRPGSEVAWHQDGSYWQHADPLALLAAWVPLTPCDAQTGRVDFIPGSHRWGILKSTDDDSFGDGFGDEAQRLPDGAPQNAPPPVGPDLAPGDLSFHHALVVHRSGPNRAPLRRLAYTIHYLSGDARYREAQTRDWQRNPELVDGGPFRGTHHPVLWRRDGAPPTRDR